MNETQKLIKKDGLIIKFCLYGFLKNLKFFEPFLVIYLLGMNLSLFQIGVLYSIREIFNYVFEIPSGIFADNYGKKTELCICFLFYITSFVFFLIAGNFAVLVIAMVFFGLGEAFRSGTHKAIILSYLEEKDWFEYKSFVYGRTRSFSLIGSSISAFLSIVFILQLDNLRGLFLLCIIPYVLDFILIASYPKRFNERHVYDSGIKSSFKNSIKIVKSIIQNKQILKIITSASVFDSIFKSIKDYIQPILQTLILASPIIMFKSISLDDTIGVYLAIIYGVIYIISSFASKNVYRLNKKMSSSSLMNLFFDLLAVMFILISLFMKINVAIMIGIIYLAIYLLKEARRPLYVDTIANYMDKKERVTVLSVESQFKALFSVLFAPLFGFIADKTSICFMFLVIAILCIVLNRFVRIKESATA